MEKEILGSWIKQREEELKLLKKEVEGLKPFIEENKANISNCKQEIQFIEKLQSKEIGLDEPESGEKLLIEMKGELESKKSHFEKNLKEWEEKIIRMQNLEVYISSAVRVW
ncbi:hypothetical protein ES702_05263 [subsurface metagenome]